MKVLEQFLKCIYEVSNNAKLFNKLLKPEMYDMTCQKHTRVKYACISKKETEA